MKFIRDLKRRSVKVVFEDSFSLRDAIGLPRLVERLGGWREVVLDFSGVRWMRESALVAMIPALNSIHGRLVTVTGLEGFELESRAVVPLAA
jgi:hypothetical protein